MVDARSEVGEFDWSGCDSCAHGNSDDGGCLLMDDAQLGDINNYEIFWGDYICCTKWEPKEADDETDDAR